jgi:N-acetylglutamate synthase
MPVVLAPDALGRRVVIRFRRSDGRPGPPLSDAVGVLRSVTDDRALIDTRSGPVEIAREDIVTARLVVQDRRSVLDLERIAALGWRPAEVVEHDGWLMRATEGWTSRANSVLPLGTPRHGLDGALTAASQFYADRGLPLRIQVPLPARGLLDAELATRCWTSHTEVVVMTRELTDEHRTGDSPEVRIQLADSLTPGWIAGYHARDGQLGSSARALLDRHPHRQFVWVVDSDETVGIARGTLDEGWLGVTAVEVADRSRRQGLASAMLRRLHAWASVSGADRSHLEVEAANTGAITLYQQLGYIEHHRYHSRVPPAD